MGANINKISIFLTLLVCFTSGRTVAQQVASPCPEVLINEKYDHVVSRQYRAQGWDTAVTCQNRSIELKAEPFIPVQFFNGTYIVESIPYNPPDTSFALGTRMPPMADDNFAPSVTQIPYPFYFFGIRKTSFILGANGMVSFSPTATGGSSCAWSYSAPIPWTDNTSGAPNSLSSMRDAIYGVYEDTDPSVTSGHSATDWGMYYGIQDAYPCRKIICSWKDMSQFSCNSMHCTYQIVCYEGSNIIEVHIKQRQVCSNWNGGRGIVGIQNATGMPQQPPASPIDPSTNRFYPNYQVVSGSPASFAAPGWNPSTTSTNNIAFRFTPQGTTMKQYKWYRLFDDGRDSVELSTDLNDTNGYYIPMNSNNSEHPTLTTARVRPTYPSRYVMELRFMNANSDWYFLRDTIFVGVDTLNTLDLTLVGANQNTTHQKDICQGQNVTANLRFSDRQVASSIRWTVERQINGRTVNLPTSMYGLDGSQQNLTLIPDPRFDTLPTNKIDSIYIQASVNFVSGCNNYDRVLVRIFPNFDTTVLDAICQGQKYHWRPSPEHDIIFIDSTDPATTSVTLQSQPGCDSVVRLKLKVYDISLTIEDTMDCKPIVWRNGRTYYETNTATAATDTVILKTYLGHCDSVVRLNFTIHPLTARIQSDIDHFTLDNLDVVLNDVSIGGDTRRWVFPSASEQVGATAYYTIPTNLDEADIKLIAHSPYGCLDSTHIVIPLQKETFWIPNAFTPDNPAGNTIFSSVSKETIRQEMYIYNRAGAMVFHCEGVDCGWDGCDNNGEKCPQGGYVYIIRYANSFEPNITRVRTGSVTLIR